MFLFLYAPFFFIRVGLHVCRTLFSALVGDCAILFSMLQKKEKKVDFYLILELGKSLRYHISKRDNSVNFYELVFHLHLGRGRWLRPIWNDSKINSFGFLVYIYIFLFSTFTNSRSISLIVVIRDNKVWCKTWYDFSISKKEKVVCLLLFFRTRF